MKCSAHHVVREQVRQYAQLHMNAVRANIPIFTLESLTMLQADLVHARRKQLDKGEIFAGLLHRMSSCPVVKGTLHLY